MYKKGDNKKLGEFLDEKNWINIFEGTVEYLYM
jgi:hypothetical protein